MNLEAKNQNHEPFLLVEGVHVAYVKKEILREVSLSINRGEIVTVLGGNGSGKSTLLKTIAGLLQPSKGLILYKGRDITTLSVHNRQKLGIGYLLQGGRVFPNLTARENFEIAMKHRCDSCNGTGVKLGSVFPALLDKANSRAGLLSGGQRQMLAIEMVLAQEPELALLDEPTGALSHDLAIDILSNISGLVKKTACCVLLVEQNVEAARKICDRYLSFNEGRVVPAMPNEILNKKFN